MAMKSSNLRMLLANLVVVALMGCSSDSPQEDAWQGTDQWHGTDQMISDGIVGSDASIEVDSSVLPADASPVLDELIGPCIEPTSGMEISKDTTLCSGKFIVPDPEGKGAIRIVASQITLRCLDTELEGSRKFGNGEPKEVAIVISNQTNVNV